MTFPDNISQDTSGNFTFYPVTPSNLNGDDQFYATVDKEQEENANEHNSAFLVEGYDYENPYWMPADKKEELLGQFKKLQIKNVAQKDLE